MGTNPAGMGRGWGQTLRGWGGDGKTYLLRGGDGDEIVSPRHSLVSTHGLIQRRPLRTFDSFVLKARTKIPPFLYLQIKFQENYAFLALFIRILPSLENTALGSRLYRPYLKPALVLSGLA